MHVLICEVEGFMCIAVSSFRIPCVLIAFVVYFALVHFVFVRTTSSVESLEKERIGFELFYLQCELDV